MSALRSSVLLFPELASAIDPRSCASCRKRPRVDGRKQCDICSAASGGLFAPCNKCGVNPRRKSGVKLCQECYGRGNNVSVDVPHEWWLKIDHTMSGIRQRAKHKGFTTWATRSQVAGLLKQQSYRCALSGAKLRPTKASVLGHRIPASKGGSFEVGNLFWIDREINRLMGTMEEGEFKAVCQRIAAWQQ